MKERRPEADAPALPNVAFSSTLALRARCLDYCCGQASEVRKCVSVECPSWSFRMGVNPFRQKRVQRSRNKQWLNDWPRHGLHDDRPNPARRYSFRIVVLVFELVVRRGRDENQRSPERDDSSRGFSGD